MVESVVVTAQISPAPGGIGWRSSIRRGVRKICDTLAHWLISAGRLAYRSPQEIRVAPWFAIDGDHTLRLDYDLDEESVVVDVGGYRGQWTSDIVAKYNCRVLCFEPVGQFYEDITDRFEANPRVSVFSFGLAGSDSKAFISRRDDASSIFAGQPDEEIELRAAVSCFRDLGLDKIDLIKINTEGGEYDLLEHLIRESYVGKIVNIQIQFHDFVPDALGRMQRIRTELQKTHQITYQYDFVWENWRLRIDRSPKQSSR